MSAPTRPCTEAEQAAPIDRAYLAPPRLPTGALFVVGTPLSACTPIGLPAGVVDCEGEAVESWRAA